MVDTNHLPPFHVQDDERRTFRLSSATLSFLASLVKKLILGCEQLISAAPRYKSSANCRVLASIQHSTAVCATHDVWLVDLSRITNSSRKCGMIRQAPRRIGLVTGDKVTFILADGKPARSIRLDITCQRPTEPRQGKRHSLRDQVLPHVPMMLGSTTVFSR